jgi:hypothetical protein
LQRDHRAIIARLTAGVRKQPAALARILKLLPVLTPAERAELLLRAVRPEQRRQVELTG